MSIQLPNEYFTRILKTSKGRKPTNCYVCKEIIPEKTLSYVIYLHPGTTRVHLECAKEV